MLRSLDLTRALDSTPAEWAARNQALGDSMCTLVNRYAPRGGRGLDVGSQSGAMCDTLSRGTRLTWCGIDPALGEPTRSQTGAELLPYWAHQTPFQDRSFACVLLANVYEHVTPELRTATLAELWRVLDDDGVLV